MRDTDYAHDVSLDILDDESTADQEGDTRFSPGQFLREAATILVACLGIGILVRILLG